MMLVSIPGFIVALLMLTVREPARRGAIVPTRIGEVFQLTGRYRWVYLPLFIGMGLRSAQLAGTLGWTATYFKRHFAWTQVQYGYYWAPASLVASSLGLLFGWLLAEHFQRQGRADGNIRVVIISTCISAPVGLLAPLMPSPMLALGMFAFASMTSMMAAAPENAAIQSVTPNRMRGQMTFLFLFLMNVIGYGIGPSIVPFFNDHVFGPEKIALSMAVMALLCGFPAILAFWINLKPYGRAYAAGGVENLQTA
jgi:MFS family permease